MNNCQSINKFLRSIHMGTKTFRVYRDKATDQELKQLINEALEVFKKHENNINKLLQEHYIDPVDNITLGNEFIVWMEKMKTPASNFEVGIYALKGIDMGLTKGLEFIYQHRHYKEEIKLVLKEVIDDYSALNKTFIEHLQSYCR